MKSGESVTEAARLVVGADGKHSLLARAAQAPEYHVYPPSTCAYYTYWEGLTLEVGELYNLPDAVVGIWPTNGGQAILYTGYPIGEFNAIRQDVEGRFWKTAAEVPGLTERLRAGRQADKFFGTADLPCFFRRPYGPGWALVGDAGTTLDPITGQGIGNAFRDAERLAEAVEAGLSSREPIKKAMAVYEKERNEDTGPMANFTRQIAAFEPPPLQQELLFAALEKKPNHADRFFGMLTGSVSVKEFFSPGNLLSILGLRGMLRAGMGNRKAIADARAITSANLETD
jgi:2-polyprenyl-6-methoxyphenol hydroxylase-like FAD-dependent oxidoreductase